MKKKQFIFGQEMKAFFFLIIYLVVFFVIYKAVFKGQISVMDLRAYEWFIAVAVVIFIYIAIKWKGRKNK